MGQAVQTQCKQFDIEALDFEDKPKDLTNISAVIDFSSPKGFSNCVNFCMEQKLPLVSGTTGFSEEHLALISSAKKSIPILIASNMSLGIAQLKNSIEEYLMSTSFRSKCKIIEIHHTKKKDSPSGTALEISRFLTELFKSKLDGMVEIESYRIGNVFGIHRIVFENAEGLTTFQHIANSRNIFAKGSLQAATWIQSRESGEYNFADFLNKKL